MEVFMRILNGLSLFKALIKVGCEWRGDISHPLFTERLHFSETNAEAVAEVLKLFEEDRDYKIEDNSVWIT